MLAACAKPLTNGVVYSEMTHSLSTDKACYMPSSVVTLTLHGELTDGMRCRYLHLGDVIDSHAVSDSIWTWRLPADDFTGYLAELYTGNADSVCVLATVGIDASSDWTRFPRYGFVATYDSTKTPERIEAEMAFLNRCHINGVQLQDWHYKHHWPFGGTRDSVFDAYPDIANRTNLTRVVENYIAVQHSLGMKSIFYNLCYGALKDGPEQGVKPEWYVFRDTARTTKVTLFLPKGWQSDIDMLNPGNPEWQEYIAERNDEVYAHFDFDGYQIDQLGDWGKLYDYNGQLVDFPAGFASFIHAMKNRHPNKRLIMNAVASHGAEQIVSTGQVDFCYNETWQEEDEYASLLDIIRANDRYSNNTLRTCFASYMNYGLQTGYFNTPGVILTDAVIFALGATHLELGDHMLCHEYFAFEDVLMPDDLQQAMVTYYDFLVAYENLLLNAGGEEVLPVHSPDTSVVLQPWAPALGTLTTFGRKVGDRHVLHLLNFRQANSTSWRDFDATMPAPERLIGLPLEITCDEPVHRVWVASPDCHGGAPVDVPFTQDAGRLSLTIPSILYWTMLVIE